MAVPNPEVEVQRLAKVVAKGLPPVLLITDGTGRPGGTETVRVCSMADGSCDPPAIVMSIQTARTADASTTVGLLDWPANGDMAPASTSPVKFCRLPPAASRTVTPVTVTGTGNPLVNSSS